MSDFQRGVTGHDGPPALLAKQQIRTSRSSYILYGSRLAEILEASRRYTCVYTLLTVV